MGAPKLQDIGYCAKGGTIVLKITQTKNGPIKQKVCGTWTPFVQQKYGVTNINDFLANKNDVQEQAIKTAMIAVDNEQKGKKKNDDAFLGQSLAGAPITKSGMLTAAHLVGAAGFRCSLKGRCTGSLTGTINGYRIAMDGNKVYATMYLNIFNGFEVPYANGSGWSDKNTVSTTSPAMNEMSGESDNGGNSPGSYTPVPGKTEIVQVTVSNQIADIRKKAGVHIQDISAQPSYNEIMTAMTKERFFNPEYYASMANDLGAILQEQTVVKSYISIQLEDINRLQEQINALLAARASLKLTGQSMPDLSNTSPVKSQ